MKFEFANKEIANKFCDYKWCEKKILSIKILNYASILSKKNRDKICDHLC